jgi:hypothetical protein
MRGRVRRLVARLDRARAGDQREVVSAHLAPADLRARWPRLGGAGRGEPVRLEDRHYVVDAVVVLETQVGDAQVVVSVADGADHRDLGAVVTSARAPTLSMRSATDRMSSSVAVAFITIIICWSFRGSEPFKFYGGTAIGRCATQNGAGHEGHEGCGGSTRSRPSA